MIMVIYAVLVLILSEDVLPRLVIDVEDLDKIDSNIIEERAEIVEDFLRETGCKDVQVIFKVSTTILGIPCRIT